VTELAAAGGAAQAARGSRKETTFLGDVGRIVSGTAVAQLILVLASPLLTRLFEPEAFGVAALLAGVTGIVAVVACLRYELAIVLPEDDGEAANLLFVSLLCTCVVSACTALCVWLAIDVLDRAAGLAALQPYLWLVPVMVLVQGAFTALNYWNTRTKHFARLARAQVTAAVATTSGQIAAGSAGIGTSGMILSSVIGQSLSLAVLGGQIARNDASFFAASVNRAAMKRALLRHRKFPLYSTWSALLNVGSWQLPVFMMALFFSPVVVGFYALGFRILQLPMRLVGTAIGQVFVQRAARARTEGTLGPLVEDLLQRLLVIGAFPMFALTLAGKDVYVVVFGGEWAEAGLYTQILSPWAFMWFISSPLSQLYYVVEKQEFGFFFNAVLFASRFLSLGAGGIVGSPVLALALFSGTGLVLYGYLNLRLLAFAGARVGAVLAKARSALAVSGAAVLPLAIAKLLAASPMVVVLVAAVTGAAWAAVLAAAARSGRTQRPSV
jgi:lipopolysaccharide exporter